MLMVHRPRQWLSEDISELGRGFYIWQGDQYGKILLTNKVTINLCRIHANLILMLNPVALLSVFSELGIFMFAFASFKLMRFCHSDWSTYPDSWKLVSELFISLDFPSILWKSKKQISISLNLVEAEYWYMRRVVVTSLPG